MERVCKECNFSKSIVDFPLKKNGKPKSSYCKDCYTKIYYHLNKEKVSLYKKEYYENNKEEILSKSKVYYIENKKETPKKQVMSDEERREKSRIYSLKYYYNNKEEQNRKSNKRRVKRLKSDSLYKITHNIRSLILVSFKNQFTTKSKKTIEILGCSFEEFKIHLESKFDENMNWDNQGSYWHMDHIIPISSAETEEDVYRLNHYTNFQPLYWLDNLKKGNKLPFTFF
jgi:hypothetical protein